jgi:predicted MPP superfamily phosphohydrolase
VSSFTVAALSTHFIVVAAAIAVFIRVRRGAAGWRDLVLFSTTVLLACHLGQQLVDRSQFTFMRFAAQVLFGELPLLALALATVLRRRRPGFAAIALGVSASLIAVYVVAYHVEPYRLQEREHVVSTWRGRALRIAHLSDLQAARIGPLEERAWRALAASRADLIVLTGDYVQARRGDDRRALEAEFRALMARVPLHAPLGVYAVQGDVEVPGWERLFAGTGIVPLQDQGVSLDGVRLVGLSRRTSRARNGSRIVDLLKGASHLDLRIVAGHAPDFVDALDRRQVDLVLAGHTHGGQVALPGLGPLITLSRLPRRFAGGLEDFDGVPLHVARGVGMERGTAPQLRFGVPPEVCVLDLRPRANAGVLPPAAAGLI